MNRNFNKISPDFSISSKTPQRWLGIRGENFNLYFLEKPKSRRKSGLNYLIQASPDYAIDEAEGKVGFGLYLRDQLLARLLNPRDFYKFLEDQGIDWKSKVSKKLLPDDALFIIVPDVLFIIEIKYHQGQGSTDEKLQTCDYKKKKYQMLVRSLELKVEYVYVLSEWFKKPRYKDVLDYVESVGCHYKFGSLPLAWLGLPNPA
jgi:hypothetical protein